MDPNSPGFLDQLRQFLDDNPDLEEELLQNDQDDQNEDSYDFEPSDESEALFVPDDEPEDYEESESEEEEDE